MIPGTVLDFNLGKNNDYNPEDIEPDIESLKTVDTETCEPSEMLERLFINDYTQAENKSQISKNVGQEFKKDFTQRCIKVNHNCIRTDRSALFKTEDIQALE